MSKIKILIATILGILIVSIALVFSGILPVLAQGSILVTLTDEETGKPIGRIDEGYVRVMLGGQDQGYLTDNGELKIEDVTAGNHELVLIIPHYGEKRQFVDVGSGQTVSANIVVDMPNPIFEVTVSCDTGWTLFDEYGDLTVTLTNRGNVASSSTCVLVIVHTEDDTSTPVATHMLDFPSLVPREDGGISHTMSWRCNEFVWGPKEIISVVVFDGWPYAPQNEQVVTELSIPSSLATEIGYSIGNYLKNNPDKVVETVVKACVSWFG
ncbi:MAG: hypothetical protein NWF03_08265 [Candidatus Bathyarchaeota archaeon]|nr:hypothetical protein [Candidatus Bathyarchaeota archaeon]